MSYYGGDTQSMPTAHGASVTLIEDDDVIETFAADRADDALDIGILPRRSWCSDDLLDSHRLDTTRKV